MTLPGKWVRSRTGVRAKVVTTYRKGRRFYRLRYVDDGVLGTRLWTEAELLETVWRWYDKCPRKSTKAR